MNLVFAMLKNYNTHFGVFCSITPFTCFKTHKVCFIPVKILILRWCNVWGYECLLRGDIKN